VNRPHFHWPVLLLAGFCLFARRGVSADTTRQIDRSRVGKDKVIYVDRATGKQAFPGEFYLLSGLFSEGLAAVCVDEKWGFINEAGEYVIPLQSAWSLARGFSEGLAAVNFPRRGDGTGGFGFIDRTGKLVIPPAGYGMAHDFSSGLSAVSKKVGDRFVYGFIDQTGKMVIEPKFDRGAVFKEGKANVIIGDKRAVIDKSGTYLVAPVFPREADFTYVISDAASTRDGAVAWHLLLRHKGADLRFGTVNALLDHLATLPKGSVIDYSPSDASAAGWPRLLEPRAEMIRLETLCKSREINLKIHPGG
jgi:hypothetical protein